MTEPLRVLTIEQDGHFRGGSPVKPWVAEIVGLCPRYGLRRDFIRPMNDYQDARVAWSGNLYGLQLRYPLREGRIYEVSRTEGKPSKRLVTRRFRIAGARWPELQPADVLEAMQGGAPGMIHDVVEGPEPGETWVARVERLGRAEALGYVLRGGVRIYRLAAGLHEVVASGDRSLLLVENGQARRVTDEEALTWIR